MGSLFMKCSKAKQITSDSQLLNTILYVHLNPVKHGFTKDFKEWKWSSCNSYILDMPNNCISKGLILDVILNLNEFFALHNLKEKMILKNDDLET